VAYYTITECLITANIKNLYNSWNSSDASFVQKHVLARGAHLLLAPASLITTAIDTIAGLGAAIGAILTLGQSRKIFDVAAALLNESNFLLSYPYQNFLQAINPDADFGDIDAYIVSNAISPIEDFAKKCAKSENFLQRHVASRLTYALAALACLVTRAVDGVISIPIVAASVITLGNFTLINHLACNTLKAPGIIVDLVYCAVYVLNPHIKIQKDLEGEAV
jgi:hypothetical protein